MRASSPTFRLGACRWAGNVEIVGVRAAGSRLYFETRGAWRSMCLFDFAGVGHWEETVHEIVTRAIVVGQVLPPFLYFPAKRSRGMGSHGIFCYYNYLAYSTALVSRMTLTLIWPGYSSSDSIFFATSRASRIILSSVTSSGLTMMRTSRPAWMA